MLHDQTPRRMTLVWSPMLLAQRSVACVIFGGLLALCMQADAQKQSSGPSTTGLDKLLWVNFESIVGNERSEAEQLLPRVMEVLQKPLEETGVASYEEAHVDIERLRRISEKLQIYGEPLGNDLGIRVERASKNLRKKAEQAFADPNIQKDVKRRLATLERSIAAANNKLSDVSKLVKAGMPVEAFEKFCDITDPIDAQGIWYEIESGTRHSRIVGWDERARNYYFAARTATIEMGKKLRASIYADHKVDLKALPEAITTAAQQLAQNSQTQLTTGASVSGPEALAYFGDAWVRLQNEALTALGYARIGKYLGDADRPAITEEAFTSACDSIVNGLASIVSADAARAAPEEADQLYFAYLDALPPLLTRCTVPDATKRFEAALGKLVARSPDLSNRIKAYRAATDDVLRWRQRTKDAFVRSMSDTYPTQADFIATASKPFRTRNVLLLKNSKSQPLARLQNAVPNLLKETETALMNQKASFSNLLSPTAKPFVTSAYDTRSIAYVLFKKDALMPVQDELARDIYATGEQGAWTLATRMALFRLSNGDIGQAGGTITRVGLVGVPTRYVTMSDDDRGMVRLGPLEQEPESITDSDLMLMFVVQPAWFADRYTFVRLSAES